MSHKYNNINSRKDKSDKELKTWKKIFFKIINYRKMKTVSNSTNIIQK